MSQFTSGTRAHLREFVRQPVTLALIVALPPVVIQVYGTAMEVFPPLPNLGAEPITAGHTAGTLFAVAFLAGLVGLFQVISAHSSDDRLAWCGFRRLTLLASRLVTTVVVAGAGALVSFSVFRSLVAVEAPAAAFGALVLAGLIYGLLGVLVGVVIPRELEGSLVLVFVADVDNALSSGLFETDVALAKLFPLYYPHVVFEEAALEGTLAVGAALTSLAYLAVLVALTFTVYAFASGDGGVLS